MLYRVSDYLSMKCRDTYNSHKLKKYGLVYQNYSHNCRECTYLDSNNQFQICMQIHGEHEVNHIGNIYFENNTICRGYGTKYTRNPHLHKMMSYILAGISSGINLWTQCYKRDTHSLIGMKNMVVDNLNKCYCHWIYIRLLMDTQNNIYLRIKKLYYCMLCI